MTQLTETQFVTGTAAFVTRKGSPAEVQNPVFSSSDPSVIAVAADPANPLSATVTAGAPGAAQLQLEVDADMGDGVETIRLVSDFVVVAGKAVGGTFSFGTPQEQVI